MAHERLRAGAVFWEVKVAAWGHQQNCSATVIERKATIQNLLLAGTRNDSREWPENGRRKCVSDARPPVTYRTAIVLRSGACRAFFA